MSKNRNNDSTFEIDKPHMCILYTYIRFCADCENQQYQLHFHIKYPLFNNHRYFYHYHNDASYGIMFFIPPKSLDQVNTANGLIT